MKDLCESEHERFNGPWICCFRTECSGKIDSVIWYYVFSVRCRASAVPPLYLCCSSNVPLLYIFYPPVVPLMCSCSAPPVPPVPLLLFLSSSSLPLPCHNDLAYFSLYWVQTDLSCEQKVQFSFCFLI